MSELDPNRIDIEGQRNLFSKKPVFVATRLERRASGLSDDDIIGWDRFLSAWFHDRAEGSMNAPLIESLKVFILTWVLPGKGGYRIPITMQNPDNPEEVIEIEATTEKQPDFTYNPDGLKSIHDLQMPYRSWMDAVADLKLNLSGSSYGDVMTKNEHVHWGGPVDISRDIQAADLGADDPIKRVFDL